MPFPAPDRRSRLPQLVASVTVSLAVLTGCGASDDTGAPDATASDTTSASATGTDEPTASPTAEPSSSPTETAPSPTSTESAEPTTTSTPTASATSSSSGPTSGPTASPTARPARLADRLLGAGDLPGFNAEYRWTAGPVGPESPSSSFGTCQRFSVTSIGAERALVRRYRPAVAAAGADRAGELVAQFPDEMTARRAFGVLTAWRAQCADRLRQHARSQIGSLQPVPVQGGSGGWYLLTYGPVPGDPQSQFFDAQGMAVVGSRIALVSMVLAGQDYNYEPGREPMVTAVRRAAERLR
ncbi:MAG TPA: hypothetical protein VER39_12210 [Nocardioidaceae bacterium]|nr:hypothetical protein [Nocardioidaceae bacterium]